MSSRALRRLQVAGTAGPQQEAKEASAIADEEDDVEPEDDPKVRAARKAGSARGAAAGNQFALLMAASPQTDDTDGSEKEEKAQEEAEDSQGIQQQQQIKKQKQKKSKKDKRKDRWAEVLMADEFDVPAAVAATAPATVVATAAANRKPLLSVDLRLLDGGQELRRLFGQAAGEPASLSAGPSRRGGGGVARARGGLLVRPKPTWPPVVRLGLSMSADPSPPGAGSSNGFPEGSAVYRFEHSREYQRAQVDFAEAVESGLPERLAEVLHRRPYHVDSLLQLAEVFRIQEDSATAADLVERALHGLECAMSPGFSVVSDRCRLSFARRENRAMFTALLRHALALAGRCCHRACLETCKLLLSLSPTADPMGALLLLDAACLMSGQEEFLLRLMQAWEPSRHLSQLPNWAYSGALARFRLGRPDAPAALDEALILFPSVLPPLLARLSVDPGPRVSACPLFSDTSTDTSTGLRQLQQLYVQRCGHCWKEAAAVSFLVAGAARVAAAASVTPPDPRVAEFAERRRRRYRRTPLNVLRHLVVSDVRDALADLPPDIDPAGVNAFDPLPPPDSVCDYDLRELRRRVRGAQRGGGSAAEDDGLLAAFLRSLLPNYDPSAPANPAPAGAMGGGGAGGGGGALAGLLDSVRQLLNGLGPPAPLFDDEGERQLEEDGEGAG